MLYKLHLLHTLHLLHMFYIFIMLSVSCTDVAGDESEGQVPRLIRTCESNLSLCLPWTLLRGTVPGWVSPPEMSQGDRFLLTRTCESRNLTHQYPLTDLLLDWNLYGII